MSEWSSLICYLERCIFFVYGALSYDVSSVSFHFRRSVMVGQQDEDLLVKQLKDMKATEEERVCVYKHKEEEIDRSDKKLENALVCKILSQKQINPEMFKSKMPGIGARIRLLFAKWGSICSCANSRTSEKKKLNLGDWPMVF